jgi:hypothetical protein
VALEAIGTEEGIAHRLRIPERDCDFAIAQLRAAIPGIAVETVEVFRPEPWAMAVEMRRRMGPADLETSDIADVSRMILAAMTGLGRGEAVICQLVISGGLSHRGIEKSMGQQLGLSGSKITERQTADDVAPVTMRFGSIAHGSRRQRELIARLERAAASVSTPDARLRPRALPTTLVATRLQEAATPVTAAATFLRLKDIGSFSAWPVANPLIPGLTLGGSPHLPAAVAVPQKGRILGKATADGRTVAQPVDGGPEHMMITGSTGVGKTSLSIGLTLDDVRAGRGGVIIDPKGTAIDQALDRWPQEAIERTVVIDFEDQERPVPLPLLATEADGRPELAADMVIELLRHRYRDLGPRSTDILASSLHALRRTPMPLFIDLLRLWSDAMFRSWVTGLVRDDLILSGFFAWFNGLSPDERNSILAAPMNKIRPLLQRESVRNVLAAPRATFTMAQAMKERLVVLVKANEDVLGHEGTTLIGQVVLARIWSATLSRREWSFFPVTIDEAPRFLDQPTDIGDMLARAREYAVGMHLISQSVSQYPPDLREMALNSARTKVAFGTSARDARRLAEEFGPDVKPEFFTGLERFEAIGAVSLGGVVSPPFTFQTEELGPVIPGRADAVRKASKERFGVPREVIEEAIRDRQRGGSDGYGPVGRRPK